MKKSRKKPLKRGMRQLITVEAAILAILAILAVDAYSNTDTHKNNEEVMYSKDYISYEVQRGDSIWGIAQKFYQEDWPYDEIRSYIWEIRRLNDMWNDQINVGQKLRIPVYIPERKIINFE